MTARVKYPRTPHLPWSPGRSADDEIMHDASERFADSRVVVTEKLDGECTTLYRDGLHARSTTYSPHPSRDHLRAMHAKIAHDIPEGWRICGENLYAQHSIAYRDLPGYFMVFSVWDGERCLPWDETVEWAGLLELPTVPLVLRGDGRRVVPLMLYADWSRPSHYSDEREGYVMRIADGFTLDRFSLSVAKYVRAGHVQTDEHWMHRAVVPNGLAAR